MMDRESDKSKEEQLREVVNGSGVTLFSISFNRVIRALFAYVITFFGGAAAYGVVSVLQKMSIFVVYFLSGPLTGIQRSLPRYSEESGNLILSLNYAGMTAVSGLIGISAVYFRDLIIANTVLSQSNEFLIYLFGLNLIFLSFFFTSTAFFKSKKQIKIFNLLRNIIRPLAEISIVLVSLLVISDSVPVIWGAVVASTLLASLAAVYFLRKHSVFSPRNYRVETKDLKDFIYFSIPSAANSALVTVQMRIFFVFMAFLLTPVQAGVFGLGLALSVFTRWPLVSVNQILPPVATELYDEGVIGEIRSLYRETTRLILYATIPLATVTVIYFRELVNFFSPEYSPYALVLPIMVLGQFIASNVGSVGLLLSMTDNQKEKAVMNVFLTAAVVIFSAILTLEYGVIGLAVAYTASFTLNNIFELLLLYYKRNMEPYTWKHGKIGLVGLIYFILALSTTFLGLKTSIVLVAALTLVYLKKVWKVLGETERIVLDEIAETAEEHLRKLKK